MQASDFKAIIMTFADPGTEILFDKSQIVICVNGDTIDARITTRSGDIYVDEGSGEEPASKWILTRLARLPLLASRLQESVPQTEFFVRPSATLLPTLEKRPQEQDIETSDAMRTTLQTIEECSPLETMVLYVTSDAGEGKTSLINELARKQASLFSENKSDWLLVPIPLGGRHFLRFDDITVGALQNRYRFPFLYWKSFIALVRMRVIVPAFDGFEEMFVESSSGEALSAMGILVNSLESRGAIIIAARKAYFEFENLRTKEKLFDAIRSLSVGFGKIELHRWAQSQFLEYCQNRGIRNSEEIYHRVSERLTVDHPLLTRAVLVKRLLDVAVNTPTLDALLEQVSQPGTNFISVFVRSLIEREASEKWIDRSGEKDIGTPLLSIDEHCELLSLISLAMWESHVDHIKRDHLEFISDLFCETAHKNALQAQQIRERIRGHAMLIPSVNASQAVEFDHDEFRLFFLGEGIARQIQPLSNSTKAKVFASLRRGVLPNQAQLALILAANQDQRTDRLTIVRLFLDVSKMDAQASFAHQNCSDIIIQLLNGVNGGGLEVCDLSFTIDALRFRKLSGVVFKNCIFSPTSMESTMFEHCYFVRCRFVQLRVFESTRFTSVVFNECAVDALALVDENHETWVPDEISKLLQRLGVEWQDKTIVVASSEALPDEPVDEELRDVDRLLRCFMRSTHINENVLRMKFGVRSNAFFNDTLPALLRLGIIEDVPYLGSGVQRRFKVGLPLQQVNAALEASRGSFSTFLRSFQE